MKKVFQKSCRGSNFMYYLLFYLTLILVFYYIEQGLYQYCNYLKG